VTFLVVTYGIFAALIRLLGAAASELRLTIMPGLVDGIREWAEPDAPADGGPTRAEIKAEPPWEELPPGGGQVGEARSG
jgi:hypothetical protein